MISKEEIENHIELVKLPQYEANSTEKALVEYIEQLENKVRVKDEALKEFGQAVKDMCSDKQKLIDKLEEKIKYYEENDEILASNNDNYSDGTVIYRFIKEFKEILSIVKGEKKYE